jgi:hypothetical protein
MTDDGPQMVGPYAVLYSLGAGSTGKVRLAQHSQSGLNVAIKVVTKSHVEKSPELKTKVHREIALMRLFDHPHLLKLVEVCESPHHLYIVLESAQHGELFDFLISSQSLSVDVAMKLFCQIIPGVEFLHTLLHIISYEAAHRFDIRLRPSEEARRHRPPLSLVHIQNPVARLSVEQCVDFLDEVGDLVRACCRSHLWGRPPQRHTMSAAKILNERSCACEMRRHRHSFERTFVFVLTGSLGFMTELPMKCQRIKFESLV